MTLTEIFNIFESTTTIKNYHYFDRYKKLVRIYNAMNLVKSKYRVGDTESHHILPRKMYPEFTDSIWNRVLLPGKAHYIAHYLLFKSVGDRSCVYAFNQMRRITKNTKLNCRLYATVRIEFAKLISENNKGRIKTERQLAAISESNKGTNTYRSPAGILQRFRIGTEPNGWVSFQTGRVRSESSRNKIRNSIAGRIWQYNPTTGEVKFEKKVLTDFITGFPPWFNSAGIRTAETVWVHDPITGKNKRLKQSDSLPTGYEFGRIFDNKGFDRINNQGLVRVLDLLKKEFCLVKEQDMDKTKHVKHGSALDKIYLYKYNKVVYTSRKDFFENNRHLPVVSGGAKLFIASIPPPHWNQTIERQEFSKHNQGKTFTEIGVEIIALADYLFNKEEIYVSSR